MRRFVVVEHICLLALADVVDVVNDASRSLDVVSMAGRRTSKRDERINVSRAMSFYPARMKGIDDNLQCLLMAGQPLKCRFVE